MDPYSETFSGVGLRYPLRAVVVVVLAWLYWALLCAAFAHATLALFAVSPALVIGWALMVGEAHAYARRVATPVREPSLSGKSRERVAAAAT